jgi:acyl-CoA dehydrogenase
VLGTALPLIMSAYLGIADEAVAIATELARPKAEQPHIPPLVGTMRNQRAMAEDAVASMVARADGLRFDATNEAAAYALTRKTIAATAIQSTVRVAMEIAGGAAYGAGHPLARLHRDSLGSSLHPLPESKQVQFTGRVALGLSPVA